MYSNEASLERIGQELLIAKQRLKIDPHDSTPTSTYIDHVERLLIELEITYGVNRIQARHIREYIEQRVNAKAVAHGERHAFVG